MPDDEKKLFIDDDWKAEAKREKERLAAQQPQRRQMPPPSFAELVNIIMIQAMAGLGLLAGPGGERVPPDLEAAKHFVDMLQLLEQKTQGNLTPEEKTLLDQVMYEARMAFVQVASGGAGASRSPGVPPKPPTVTQ